jgi:hypothetical protein
VIPPDIQLSFRYFKQQKFSTCVILSGWKDIALQLLEQCWHDSFFLRLSHGLPYCYCCCEEVPRSGSSKLHLWTGAKCQNVSMTTVAHLQEFKLSFFLHDSRRSFSTPMLENLSAVHRPPVQVALQQNMLRHSC